MSRRTTITDDQILEAARAVFLEDGFRATTAKIARQAGVSEGSIFKRYPTKEALFFAALDINPNPDWHRMVADLSVNWRGREGLADLFFEMLAFFNDVLPRVMTMVGCRVGPQAKDLFSDFPEPEAPPKKDFRILEEFFRLQSETGRLRCLNPGRTVHVIFGTLIHYVFESIVTMKPLEPTDFRAIAEGTLDVVWFGIQPTDESPTSSHLDDSICQA